MTRGAGGKKISGFLLLCQVSFPHQPRHSILSADDREGRVRDNMADDTEKAIIYAFDHTGSVAPELRERALAFLQDLQVSVPQKTEDKKPNNRRRQMTRTRFVPSLPLLLLLFLCRSCTRACHAHAPAHRHTHAHLFESIRYHRRRRRLLTCFPLIPIVLTSPSPTTAQKNKK